MALLLLDLTTLCLPLVRQRPLAVGLALGGGLLLLALAMAMAASLAGATHLPVMRLMFSLRLVGDQQLLPGVLLASVLGAGVGRGLMRRGGYHALTERLG